MLRILISKCRENFSNDQKVRRFGKTIISDRTYFSLSIIIIDEKNSTLVACNSY